MTSELDYAVIEITTNESSNIQPHLESSQKHLSGNEQINLVFKGGENKVKFDSKCNNLQKSNQPVPSTEDDDHVEQRPTDCYLDNTQYPDDHVEQRPTDNTQYPVVYSKRNENSVIQEKVVIKNLQYDDDDDGNVTGKVSRSTIDVEGKSEFTLKRFICCC